MSFVYKDKLNFVGFAPGDPTEDMIRASIEYAYNKSSIFAAMFDQYFAQPYTLPLVINFAPGEMEAQTGTGILGGEGGFAAGQMFVDLNYLNQLTYIDNNGTAEPVTLDMAIVHELVHSLTGKEDKYSNTDYKGDTVTLSNEIYAQLKLGINEENSYLGQDDQGVLIPGFEYTDGVPIDKSFVAGGVVMVNWDSSPAGDSKDLLIGDTRANSLKSGGGDDFLYGNGGNDELHGGADNDKVYGGDGDDKLYGEGGNDTLTGGSGKDVYYFESGGGADRIVDEDGGMIFLQRADGERSFIGGYFKQTGEGASSWKSADGQSTLTQGATWSLSLQGGGSIDFASGTNLDQFGFALIAYVPEAELVDPPILEDLEALDTRPDPGFQYSYDTWGNVKLSGEAEPDREDVLYDRNGAELVRAGGTTKSGRRSWEHIGYLALSRVGHTQQLRCPEVQGLCDTNRVAQRKILPAAFDGFYLCSGIEMNKTNRVVR